MTVSLSAPAAANRLIDSSSPYLLQHAHNPVDWYPWGEEAFAKARQENKPILLSIGYSTCYWCHVMEREIFENPEIAKLKNLANQELFYSFQGSNFLIRRDFDFFSSGACRSKQAY